MLIKMPRFTVLVSPHGDKDASNFLRRIRSDQLNWRDSRIGAGSLGDASRISTGAPRWRVSIEV